MIILNIIIILITLVVLLALHEMGHFLLAKKFGVRVEEFGIGYPPRLFGKKIGETIYSLNLLPFGAFVRILGEGENIQKEDSFSQKPIWQRMLIVLGGVVMFWIIAFLLLTLIAGVWGIPQAISDETTNLPNKPYVEILSVSPNSPAGKAKIGTGDIIKAAVIDGKRVEINKIQDVQKIASEYAGKKITLVLREGNGEKEVSLVPRSNPPEGEGPIGVALARIVNVKYSWLQAPIEGAKITLEKTIEIPVSLFIVSERAIKGEKTTGVEVVGPIGILQLLNQFLSYGWANFLFFISMISIWLALFNVLPIPALDGGKFLFLIIEAIRKRPINEKVEQQVTAWFFFALIALMVYVTIKDVIRIF